MIFSGYSNVRRVSHVANSLFGVGQVFMALWIVLIPVSDMNSPRTTWPLLLLFGVVAMSTGNLLQSNPRSIVMYRLWAGATGIVFFGIFLFNFSGAASHNSVILSIIASTVAMIICDSRVSRNTQAVHTSARLL